MFDKAKLDKSMRRLAIEIKGKDRYDAEKHLVKYGMPIALSSSIVACLTSARTQTVIDSIDLIELELSRQVMEIYTAGKM